MGYLCTRTGVFSEPDLRVLGKFVLNLALPPLLFNAIAQRPAGCDAHGLPAGLWPGLRGHAAVRLLLGPLCEPQHRQLPRLLAMGTACSNSGYMGYPVAQLVLGSAAPVALALNMLFENLIKLPVLLTLADNADAGAHRPGAPCCGTSPGAGCARPCWW